MSLYFSKIILYRWIQNLKPKNQKKRNVVTCKLLYGKKKTEEAGLRTGKRILATAGKMLEKCHAVSPQSKLRRRSSKGMARDVVAR